MIELRWITGKSSGSLPMWLQYRAISSTGDWGEWKDIPTVSCNEGENE